MRRRSTVGWSVQQVLLDCFGGVLSVLQLLLEASVLQEVSLVTGDPIKPLLGLVSIGYDVVLILQHYYWYPEAKAGQMGDSEIMNSDDEGSHSRTRGFMGFPRP